MAFDPTELAIIRRAYAKHVLAAAGVQNERLETAFATVRRERFLGPGPWHVHQWWSNEAIETPNADPVYVYADILLRLPSTKGMNNGQPSYHARLYDALNPRTGEHVVHIGAGTGYFTAILAEMVGPAGHVTAFEIESELADFATEALSDYAQATVINGDATALDFEDADAIYVNAGATYPPDRWLDRLTDRGRMILPLTRDKRTPDFASSGLVFMIARDDEGYSANWLSRVSIYPCRGARDETTEAALARAIEKGSWEFVKRFHRDGRVDPNRCWLWTDNFCFSYD